MPIDIEWPADGQVPWGPDLRGGLDQLVAYVNTLGVGDVESVNGQTGEVTLDPADIGAANASHTHPVSDVTGLTEEMDGVTSTAVTTFATARAQHAPAFNLYFPEVHGARTTDGVELFDSAPAIQATINEMPRGGRLVLRHEQAGGKYYYVGSTITVPSTANAIVIEGDSYNSFTSGSIRSGVDGPMFLVDAAATQFRNMSFLGVGGEPAMDTSTTDAIWFRGITTGDVDAVVSNCEFAYMRTGIECYGRNLEVVDSLFSGVKYGVTYRGNWRISNGQPDDYHVNTAVAKVFRGAVVHGNRFHAVGTGASDVGACVYFHETIEDFRYGEVSANVVDNFCRAKFVLAIGGNDPTPQMLVIRDNSLIEQMGSAVDIRKFTEIVMDNNAFNGTSAPDAAVDMVVLTDVNIANISNLTVSRSARHVIKGTNVDLASFTNVKAQLCGLFAAGDGLNLDANSGNIVVNGFYVNGTTGWGINGNFVGSIVNVTLGNCTLGRINSTTVKDEEVFVPGAELQRTAGSPAIGTVGSFAAMMLDPATTEAVASFVQIPAGWTRFGMELVWAPTVTGAGSVQFQAGFTAMDTGTVIGTGSLVTVTAPVASGAAANQVHVTSITTSATIPASKYVGVRVIRDGANASDTYASDVAILGFRMYKVL